MLSLPLFVGPQTLVLEDAETCALDAGCTRCNLYARAKTVCMPDDGDAGGVLIIGEAPGRPEDAAGRPFAGQLGSYIRPRVERLWQGPIAYANACRCCPGNSVIGQKQVKACRGYLAQTLLEAQPTRILVLGGWAAASVIGDYVPTQSTRECFAHTSTGVPVFFLLNPIESLRNRFMKAAFELDLEHALTRPDPMPFALDGVARVIETADDALTACAELRTAGAFAFDVETTNHQFDADFRIISIACATGWDEVAWVWDTAAIASRECLQPLLDLLADPAVQKIGQNVKYDAISVRCAWDVAVQNVVFDTRLARRLLQSDAASDLSTLALRIGVAQHKGEADTIRVAAQANANRFRREQRKHWKSDGADPAFEPPPDVRDDQSYELLPRDVLVRYNGRDAIVTAALRDELNAALWQEPELLETWRRLVVPAARAAARVEEWGIAVDSSAIHLFDSYLAAKMGALQPRFDIANVNPSSPKDVGRFLFETCGIKPPKQTDAGQNCTDEKTLKMIAGQHPLIAALLEWRHYAKLRGTYATGMLKHVRADGRVHPSINLDGASTGRTSSSDPNIQNIPRPDEDVLDSSMARNCFVTPEGYTFLNVDYSQIELRVAAMLSGDAEMTAAFASGEDFHMRTARMVSQRAWGIPPDAVTKAHRSMAKAINFGVLYGKSAATFARDLKITIAKAEEIVNAILGRFHRLRDWTQAQLAYARKHGCTWTYWNGQRARRRPLWHIGSVQDYVRENAEKASWNTSVQGTASEYLVQSMVELIDWIDAVHAPAKVVAPVHDSLLIEVRNDWFDRVYDISQEIMLSWYSGDVPLVVDAESGPAWGSLKSAPRARKTVVAGA